MFQETMEAMRIMGIPEDEQMGKAGPPGVGVRRRQMRGLQETSFWLRGWGSLCNGRTSLKNSLDIMGKPREQS